MSVHQNLEVPKAPNDASMLLKLGAAGFERFADTLQPLREVLDTIDGFGNIEAIKSAAKIRRDMDRFEPSITMIGQIKSGKTTLVNAMMGEPDLLPADVNPWTSVVTSMHLCPRELTPEKRAVFRFFDNEEWDRLVKGGGRVGELAGRAGAEHELSKILEQAEAMRQKARQRLGRKFELLLGSKRDYGYFDKELIARYVCLGDGDGQKNVFGRSTGHYADVTRSADLYMQQPALPVNLCIRDTPGVNDTFMVREQITINAIRESRICVVVLSAHQALSSSDLAMIRLISSIKARDVIIFVNRIDELADPANEVPLIRDSIQQTLEDHNGPKDAEVIFGSALWAQTAAQKQLPQLPKASLEACFNWAEATSIPHSEDSDPHELLWMLSGVPAIFDAVAARVAEGEGQEMRARWTARATNLLSNIRATDNLAAKRSARATTLRVPVAEFKASLEAARAEVVVQFEAALNAHLDSFHLRVDRAHDSFLTRATVDLSKHLETYGDETPWTYDPAGLRVLLQSGYNSFGAKAQGVFKRTIQDVTATLQNLAQASIGLDPALYDPQTPVAPHVPPPVAIGQTIALDLRGRWWKTWWARRQSYMSRAERFQDLVRSETKPLINDLKQEQAQLLCDAMRKQLDAFLSEQIDNLLSVGSDGQSVQVDRVLSLDVLERRDREITRAALKLEETFDAR